MGTPGAALGDVLQAVGGVPVLCWALGSQSYKGFRGRHPHPHRPPSSCQARAFRSSDARASPAPWGSPAPPLCPRTPPPMLVLHSTEKSKDRGSNTIGARLSRVEDKVGTGVPSTPGRGPVFGSPRLCPERPWAMQGSDSVLQVCGPPPRPATCSGDTSGRAPPDEGSCPLHTPAGHGSPQEGDGHSPGQAGLLPCDKCHPY